MVQYEFVQLYEILLSYDEDSYWDFRWYVGYNKAHIWHSQMSFWWNDKPTYIFKEL